MKYISVVVFAVLLTWTWSIINNSSPVSFETHAAIQSKVAQIILETIRSKKPNALEVTIDQIWTENINESNLIAHFIYKYKEATAEAGTTESKMSGSGKLERLADDGSGIDRWKLFQVKTTNDAISFEDTLLVTSEDNASPPEKSND